MNFTLVIPLWNEEKNIHDLVAMVEKSGLPQKGLQEVILVNNGSTDRTGPLLTEIARRYSWIKDVHLTVNQNYGGGVYEGLKYSQTDIVAYIPGDLQVSADDVFQVWEAFQNEAAVEGEHKLFVKGHRTVRKDGFNTRLVSIVYTLLANLFLGVQVKDVNGLPKMFHKDLIRLLPEEKMKTFVFDAQLIYTARRNRWTVREIPVTFHARREGVSSWSRKRMNTYWTTLRQMLRLRRLAYPGAQGGAA